MKITHTKGSILQEDHYYPFGMNISALSSTAPLSKPNQFKYNGKEFDASMDLNWYDYQARQYDPQLGRFTSMDPVAGLMTRFSPYAYAFDNPIRFTDPDGMMPEDRVSLFERIGGRYGRGSSMQDTFEYAKSIAESANSSESQEQSKKPKLKKVFLDPGIESAGELLVYNLREMHKYHKSDPEVNDVNVEDVVNTESIQAFSRWGGEKRETNDYEIGGIIFEVSVGDQVEKTRLNRTGPILFNKMETHKDQKPGQMVYVGKNGAQAVLSWGKIEIRAKVEHENMSRENWNNAQLYVQDIKRLIYGLEPKYLKLALPDPYKSKK